MFIIFTSRKIILGDQFKVNEMGRECGTNGREQKCTPGFGEKN